jgi:hypothetical protein
VVDSKPELTGVNLTEPQRVAANLIARGQKQKLIAEQLSVTEKTICNWKQNPEFMALVRQDAERLRNQPLEAVRDLVPKAINRIDGILDDSDNEKVVLAAASEVLAYTVGKPSIVNVTQNISVPGITFVSGKDDADKFVEQDDVVEGEFSEATDKEGS